MTYCDNKEFMDHLYKSWENIGIAKLYHKMALYKSIKQPKNISGMSKFAQSLNVSRKSLAAVGSATLRCLGTATPWRVLVAWSFGCERGPACCHVVKPIINHPQSWLVYIGLWHLGCESIHICIFWFMEGYSINEWQRRFVSFDFQTSNAAADVTCVATKLAHLNRWCYSWLTSSRYCWGNPLVFVICLSNMAMQITYTVDVLFYLHAHLQGISHCHVCLLENSLIWRSKFTSVQSTCWPFHVRTV